MYKIIILGKSKTIGPEIVTMMVVMAMVVPVVVVHGGNGNSDVMVVVIAMVVPVVVIVAVMEVGVVVYNYTYITWTSDYTSSQTSDNHTYSSDIMHRDATILLL